MLGGPRYLSWAVRQRPALAGQRLFSSSSCRSADFTHVVIGGGVVGLAAARALARRAASEGTATSAPSSVLLLERHGAVGTETSARNSEVIHAGLYYGADSLKTELCIRGRQLLYAFCAAHGVGHRRTGKWLVAQTAAQHAALDEVRAFGAAYEEKHGAAAGSVLPLRWLSAAEAQRREPAVRAVAGVLESGATGIVDSHGLMQALLGGLEEAGGEVALASRVVGIAPLGDGGRDGWELQVRPGTDSNNDEEEPFRIVAETIVNAAGLGAADVHNMIVGADSDRALSLYFAKGNYFSYGSSTPRVSTLVYPAPEPGLAGLGTHLTLDLVGRIRFGPDVEWVDDPTDLAVHGADRLAQAVEAIRTYLPDVDATALQPDYAGIRPKLRSQADVRAGRGWADFVVRREPGYHGWVNLLGIESPGLTSSLAIGERVEELLYA